MADVLSVAALLALVALPGAIAALGLVSGGWWAALLLVAVVAGVAVVLYATGECDPDDYCDEARGFWPFVWVMTAVASSGVGAAIGGLGLLVLSWTSRRRARRRPIT